MRIRSDENRRNDAEWRWLAIAMLSAMLMTPERCARGGPDSADKAPAEERESQSAEEQSAAEKRRLRGAREHLKRLTMRAGDGPGGEVAPVERPLLAYGDPARIANHGTLWAFGPSGRPAAFMELWQGSADRPFWYHSLIRTSDQDLLLLSPDGRRWQPPRDRVARTKIDEAPPPAEAASARLRQLKALSKRFAAHEIGDPNNSRYELRLLVQPVHRYDDAESGIQDGAAFVFAHGTNPELIVLLEALGDSAERARWHYSAFPSSSAELHLEIDGREVWTRPGALNVVGRPTDDYWLFSLPVESEPPSDKEETSADENRTGASK